MIDPILATTHDHMKKALEVSSQDIAGIRSGRATPALVENIVIAAYGGTQHLRVMEMATITTMDAKTIVIAPYDPSVITEIEKGITDVNRGFSPVVDGDIIRITIPPLSEERRQEYVKLVKARLETGRVMVRQIRHEAMRQLKKSADEKSISEDQQKHGERLVQEMTDEIVAELDTIGDKKEQELLQV
jgi:ribosome recycling factor